MAKEFVKGVTVGEATAEENTQPAVSTVAVSYTHLTLPTKLEV